MHRTDLTGSYVELPLHGTGKIVQVVTDPGTGERIAVVKTHDEQELELSLRYVTQWIV